MRNILFFVLLPVSVFSQSNSMDQRDERGKKDGTWKLYYDKYFHVVNDSSKASYFFYTYYDHGKRAHTHAAWGAKDHKFIDSTVSGQTAGIKMLDGKYRS